MSRNQLIHGLTLDDPRRSFIRVIERMTHARRSWEIFRDFCELAACAYTNVAPHVRNEKREARYLEIAKGVRRASDAGDVLPEFVRGAGDGDQGLR